MPNRTVSEIVRDKLLAEKTPYLVEILGYDESRLHEEYENCYEQHQHDIPVEGLYFIACSSFQTKNLIVSQITGDLLPSTKGYRSPKPSN